LTMVWLPRRGPSLNVHHLVRLQRVRSYNFAATSYSKCFDREGIPAAADGFFAKLRKDTVDYIDRFDPATWSSDPVVTMLNGEALTGGSLVETTDAFRACNGKLVEATPDQVDAVIEHVARYRAPTADYRSEVRKMEAAILDVLGGSPWPAFLVGNQALDFKKQDGVTEIEESVQANVVEQRLNDLLLADEALGKVSISRSPAFVGTVSNFTNFLDLCRKTLRNLELGVPVVVLSRSNTTQHMFRWAQMLITLLPQFGIEPGMVTYLSATREEQARVLSASGDGCPAYFTCSREVARAVRAQHSTLMASTAGPNTLVASRLTPEVAAAIKLSATIENSGQCTALRHAVVECNEGEVEAMLSAVPTVASSADALRRGEFAGLLDTAGNVMVKDVEGYTYHPQQPNVAYRVSSELPPDDLAEMWRNVYVDVTSPPASVDSPDFLASLCAWLVSHQPISVAVNADDDFGLAKKLFERTGQVVFTVGDLATPALTCQARPQDGEIFVEFPTRRRLLETTKFPVYVPSSTPAYNTTYCPAYLTSRGSGWSPEGQAAQAAAIANAVSSDQVRGYLRELTDYLTDALQLNPKRGYGKARTALYGLQTTPLTGQLNYIRCGPDTSLDDLAPYLMPFVLTNAHSLLALSIAPENSELAAALAAASLSDSAAVETDAQFAETIGANNAYNVIEPVPNDYPLVGQFVSLLLCLGHVKSTKPDHEAFIDAFSSSPKWLRLRS